VQYNRDADVDDEANGDDDDDNDVVDDGDDMDADDDGNDENYTTGGTHKPSVVRDTESEMNTITETTGVSLDVIVFVDC
jgi:hypothetical protein